jgi:hypothetical protein
MTFPDYDRPPLSPDDPDYASKRVKHCCEILAAGVEALHPRYHPVRRRRVSTPYERYVAAAGFASWPWRPERRISWVKLLRQPIPPSQPQSMPCDNWPPDPAAMREFEAYVDDLLDRQQLLGDYLEAAE